MASARERWKNIRGFLDDLPTEHCHVKPPHEFCTICMRINYRVAHDCPLFHKVPKRSSRPVSLREEELDEPIKDHLTSDDVKQALEGDEFPIIEFSGPRGETVVDDEEEEVIDVEPIDVEPIVEKPSPPKKAAEGAAPSASATAAHKPDPDELMHRIMEELEEFPEEEPEEEDEAEVAEYPEEVGEGEKEPEPETEEATEEEGEGEKEPGPDAGEAKKKPEKRPEKGSSKKKPRKMAVVKKGPPVVEKKEVRKRVPKASKSDEPEMD